MTYGLFNVTAASPPEDQQLYYPAQNYPGYDGHDVEPPPGAYDTDIVLGFRGRILAERTNTGDPTWITGPYDPPIPWLNLDAGQSVCVVSQRADGSGQPTLAMVPVGDATWDIPDGAFALRLVLQLELAANFAPDGFVGYSWEVDPTQSPDDQGTWQPRDFEATPVVPNAPILSPWTTGASPWGTTGGSTLSPKTSPFVTMRSLHNTFAPPANNTPKNEQNLWPGGTLVIPAMRPPAITDVGEDYRSTTQFWPMNMQGANPPIAAVAITSAAIRYTTFGGGGGGDGSSGSGSGADGGDLNWGDLDGINLSGLPLDAITGKLLSTGIRFG